MSGTACCLTDQYNQSTISSFISKGTPLTKTTWSLILWPPAQWSAEPVSLSPCGLGTIWNFPDLAWWESTILSREDDYHAINLLIFIDWGISDISTCKYVGTGMLASVAWQPKQQQIIYPVPLDLDQYRDEHHRQHHMYLCTMEVCQKNWGSWGLQTSKPMEPTHGY